MDLAVRATLTPLHPLETKEVPIVTATILHPDLPVEPTELLPTVDQLLMEDPTVILTSLLPEMPEPPELLELTELLPMEDLTPTLQDHLELLEPLELLLELFVVLPPHLFVYHPF